MAARRLHDHLQRVTRKVKTMPAVGNKKFEYTKAGMKKAKDYAKKTGKPMKKKSMMGKYS